jgi:zinc transport system permease protein
VSEFLAALSEHAFLQNALLAGLLASVACGVVGTYVVIKRITYLAGAIAHSVLAGLGAARYLQVVHGLSWLTPMMGAVLAALLAGLTMGLVSLKAREREDTVIGAIWALGMALGVLFIASTPGYAVNLMGYLFGNILLVTPADLWLMAILDLVVLAVGLGRYRQLVAVSFDEEFARLRGVAADWYYLLLLGMVALTVVLLTAVVGIVMVIALLTLPAAIAGRLATRVWQIMAWAVIISMGFTSLGLGLSYQPDLPSGAVIILLAVGAYLAAAIGGKVWKKARP